ncbi:MAG: oligosaccharide flippase family protein [Crocinitomicaceae bacterium]|nr:oligosaccharide flippase family protein [Crocinitomicaceae bacterium]
MGTIKTQSIRATIISYIGVAVGFISSALIMPKVLSTDQIGLMKLIIAITGIFSSIFSFGIAQLLIRVYPTFRENINKIAALFWLAMRITLIGAVIALPFYYFLAPQLFHIDQEVSDFTKNEWFLIAVFVMFYFRLLYIALFGYVRMMDNVVLDAFIQDVLTKGGVLLLLILFVLNWIDFTKYVYLVMAMYLVFPFLFLWYLKKNGGIPIYHHKIKFSKPEKKEFFYLASFGLLSTIGASLYIYLDTLMVSHYLGESQVGIYGTMYLFGVIVSVPARGMKTISASVLSKAYSEGKYDEIKNIYQKSSITLLLVGGFFFVCIYSNMASMYQYLPAAFEAGSYVVLFIGLGQLFDMLFGVNHEIIAASKYYRYNTYFVFLTAISGIIFNIIFIPIYGITGAALATCLSIVSINLLRLLAVYKLFGILPFTRKTIYATLIIGTLALIWIWMPKLDNMLLSILYKGLTFGIVYISIIYYLVLSEDINKMIDKVLRLTIRKWK